MVFVGLFYKKNKQAFRVGCVLYKVSLLDRLANIKHDLVLLHRLRVYLLSSIELRL
jgi:hypothetical protein